MITRKKRKIHSNMSLYCILVLVLASSLQVSAFNVKDPTKTREATKSPAYGGHTGTPFDILNSKIRRDILGLDSISISFGDYINAIQVKYYDSDGTEDGYYTYMAPVRGKVGDEPVNISLGFDEYVSKIEGKVYNNSEEKVVLIGQLTITTLGPGYLHKVYGPFGRSGNAQNFTEEGYIVAFHGWFGDNLNSIGVYSLPSLNQSKDYGGHGGERFDDLKGKNASVVAIIKIHIWHGEHLSAFQVEYLRLGDIRFLGPLHGMDYDNTTLTILTFDKGEQLRAISGKTGDNYVDQITLTTMKEGNVPAKYGPFGINGKHSFEISGGNMLGFFGSSGNMIDRLGVYFLP